MVLVIILVLMGCFIFFLRYQVRQSYLATTTSALRLQISRVRFEGSDGGGIGGNGAPYSIMLDSKTQSLVFEGTGCAKNLGKDIARVTIDERDKIFSLAASLLLDARNTEEGHKVFGFQSDAGVEAVIYVQKEGRDIRFRFSQLSEEAERKINSPDVQLYLALYDLAVKKKILIPKDVSGSHCRGGLN